MGSGVTVAGCGKEGREDVKGERTKERCRINGLKVLVESNNCWSWDPLPNAGNSLRMGCLELWSWSR